MRIPLENAVRMIATWAPTQRWYPQKGSAPAFSLAACLDATEDVAVLLVRAGDVLLSVPVAERDEPGAVTIGRYGDVWLVDACHDEAAFRAILHSSGALWIDGDVPAAASMRVISGEQSNTSVIGLASPPWIAKVFRVIADGPNPDVVVTGALTAARCDRVPALVASASARWQDETGHHEAHLAAVSEFIDGAADAWALFRAEAERVASGGDAGAAAAPDASALGRAVGEVHAALAAAFGVQAADGDGERHLRDGLIERVAWARSAAGDALAGLDAELDRHEAGLATVPMGDAWQRIHGDLHLGQVLRHPDRGFLVLDFEGEPLRPLADRAVMEPALRDVAGMLRSFDYAAGSVAMQHGAGSALSAWAAEQSQQFLSGYTKTAPSGEVEPFLLDALVLDKALYELVYELNNRPDWVPIPLGAVNALLRRDAR